jgi:hypothetical protein
MTTPFLVCATVTAVSAFVSLGFSICVSSKSEWTDTNTGALCLREEHRVRDHQRRSICDGMEPLA